MRVLYDTIGPARRLEPEVCRNEVHSPDNVAPVVRNQVLKDVVYDEVQAIIQSEVNGLMAPRHVVTGSDSM